MGLPNIHIYFRTQASTFIQRSDKGIVGLMVKDTEKQGAHTFMNATEIPVSLSKENQEYIRRAFLGNSNQPKKVLVYVLDNDATELTPALDFFATQSFDYLAGTSDLTEEQKNSIVDWVKAQREDDKMVKAVLPNCAADHEAIINFATEKIIVGEEVYTTGQYCSRIAGLLAGTPMTISSTYATLSEVTDVSRLSKKEMDAAINAGKFIIFHDGEKVKVGRGVNSLITTTPEKGEIFRKIKIVETTDIIKTDIKKVAEDNYIGKYANSYDNKCLLITAISGYFLQMERDGILRAGSSKIEIDLEENAKYLQAHGIQIDDMNTQQIKTADTGDQVFLSASIGILDAIEDIQLAILV